MEGQLNSLNFSLGLKIHIYNKMLEGHSDAGAYAQHLLNQDLS